MPGDPKRAVLITGAASGIGAATARRFAEYGWFVAVTDIDAAAAAALAGELGPEAATAIALDVRDEAAWARAATTFGEASGGRLDALINNAGLLAAGPIGDVPADTLRTMIEVNLTGAVLGVQACLPLLKATADARIVNVASITGLRAFPEASIYSATKYALRGLGEALRDELSPDGVSVSTVYPAFAATAMMETGRDGVDDRLLNRLEAGGLKLYAPESIAKAIWKAVERRRDEAGAGGLARGMCFLAATSPPLLKLIWRWMWRRGQAKALTAAAKPAHSPTRPAN